MDGVLLAGGLASRLRPITTVTNKHLLPIYNKPMIFYGIELLRDLGCARIIIILGGNSVGDVVNLVRDGADFGVEVVYKFQHEPRGISHAIGLVEDIVKPGNFLVLLGDNIFGDLSDLRKSVKDWALSISYANPFAAFLHPSDHPQDYGQPVFFENTTVIDYFVEKKQGVDHNLIVTGLYGLHTDVFHTIRDQEPSARGELEITDTLTQYVSDFGGSVNTYKYEGFWSDCGTPEGLVEASNFMKEKDRNEDFSKR